jgi:hypothetical protein
MDYQHEWGASNGVVDAGALALAYDLLAYEVGLDVALHNYEAFAREVLATLECEANLLKGNIRSGNCLASKYENG